MFTICNERSEELHALLANASSDNESTVLILDLQRPYVSKPKPVTLLVNPRIRG